MTTAKPPADSNPVLPEQMERERVYRWANRKSLSDAFLMSRVPGHQTDVYKIINKGISENPNGNPAIDIEHPFSMTIVGIEPDHGNGLHSHTTEEVFFPLDGNLTFSWGDEAEHSLELGPWDVITIPKNVMRKFWNHGDKTVHLLAILGGTNADTKGSMSYHPSVLEAARRSGLSLDEQGRLVVPEEKAHD
ncbi:MAG: cupin domain-containing protein [Burkholderiaceae bacterium]